MAYMLSSEKLLKLISEMTESERKLLDLYVKVSEVESKRDENRREIIVTNFWKNDAQDHSQDTIGINKALCFFECEDYRCNRELESLKREISELERKVTLRRADSVKFLHVYLLEDQQAAELIGLAGRKEKPRKILKDGSSRIYELAKWIWNDFTIEP